VKRSHSQSGFTLIEVMVAMVVLSIALLALLSLHNNSVRVIVNGQEVSRAALLAQAVMSQAEMERFPDLGTTRGNFDGLFAREYPGFIWQRNVVPSGTFPDVRKVQVLVSYGPNFSQSFMLTEFMHCPVPPDGSNGALMPNTGNTGSHLSPMGNAGF
jgi:general secretion pathway protein I